MRRNLREGGGFEDMAAYSRAVRIGDRIVTSATAALDASGAAIAPGDAYGQTRAAIATALAAVQELGAAVTDVIRTRVYLAPGADWRDATRAHQEAFAGVNPANTTLFVQALIPAGALVEVELEAQLAVDAQAALTAGPDAR